MSSTSTRPLPLHTTPPWLGQATLLGCLLAACLLGIVSRPIGYLAVFWPANAILLGLLLRQPLLAQRSSTWLLAWCTYVLADWLTGSSAFVALTLNTGNLVGVWVGWQFLRRLSPQVLRFQRQRAVLQLLSGCLLASTACTLTSAWPSAYAFGTSLPQSLALWFSSEFFNYLLIVPVFLSAPSRQQWWLQLPLQRLGAAQLAPLIALLASEAASLWIGGPGAIGFIMPAMVWCAMAYGVFPTTVLSLLLCLWKTATVAMGALHFLPEQVWDVTSYRMGLALLSLAPLAVACAYSLRTIALKKLHHTVNHDYLTGTLARRAFMERGQKVLQRLRQEQQPLAVLMADIDHFKHVNDRHGHAQGDAVLQAFAQLAQGVLRPDDLLARLGGEEFAVVLPRTNHAQARAVGERICESLRSHRFALPDGQHLQVTVSVGVHAVPVVSDCDSMDVLLGHADAALYAAKQHGRNQVHASACAL